MSQNPTSSPGRKLSQQFGPLGLWTRQLDIQPTPVVRDTLAELEELGWGSLWFWEVFGREALCSAGLLLSNSDRMLIASGVASIWARDPMAMAAAQRTLTEAYPGRFVLGIGVSHGPVTDPRGHIYAKPLEKMRGYLDAMDAVPFQGPPMSEEPSRVLAALGPKMMALAGERSGGALTYNSTPETTARSRSILGPEPMLAVEQAVVLETDPDEARRIGREFVGFYCQLPNYTNEWERLGLGPKERENGGSDRLVDAIVAWGTPDAIAGRVQAHRDAGADHVCLQVLGPDPNGLPMEGWRTLASLLR